MQATSIVIPDHVHAIALCGGPYSNFAALGAFLEATAELPYRFCLGDIGGFGPHPDRTLSLILASGMVCVQGNYDHAVGHDEQDCGCGYSDPLDRSTAQISFEYTARHTSALHKAWLRTLPAQIVLRWRGTRVLLCHGSPDTVNEFVWESETDDARIERWLAANEVAGIAATHSGIPWTRATARGFWCNVGVLGRPPHHGSPDVGYAVFYFEPGAPRPVPVLRRLTYDPAPVAAAIRAEGLPEAFAESLERGAWTTCTAILPLQEQTIEERYPAPPARTPHPMPTPNTSANARHAAPSEAD